MRDTGHHAETLRPLADAARSPSGARRGSKGANRLWPPSPPR
ncbi:hypothetical protein A176_007657 [Myxococcus hansupus]|uniref:Uncharacterized protein n=1 Tax=Pseudomyxococcus hansupus TaxID=1297742 RepID=A0A0H4XAN9_9BACT|nr:hypothetical protein A176_007657 [Myxococcus hansupus]